MVNPALRVKNSRYPDRPTAFWEINGVFRSGVNFASTVFDFTPHHTLQSLPARFQEIKTFINFFLKTEFASAGIMPQNLKIGTDLGQKLSRSDRRGE
jgi:hypothetical protein